MPMTNLPQSRGFTLIETLVATAILVTALIGPFVAIQSSIQASYAARDQLVATMLAQEAIEYVRSTRDGNYMQLIQSPGSGRSWLQGLDGTNSSTNCVDSDIETGSNVRCMVDPFGTPTVSLCGAGGGGACTPLNFSTNGIYTQEAGTATRFTRYLTMESVSATQMRVQVTVTFVTGHKQYTSRIEEYLFNWL